MSPATIVGSANGRSMNELTMLLPRNSSRTSTHAISVPASALITTTITEAISVSRSAATACGLLTAFQNESNAAVERLEEHRRQRDQGDDAQVRHGDPAAKDVSRDRDADLARCRGCRCG